MTPLQAFLEEWKARPKYREAVRDGTLLHGKPVQHWADWWAALFDRLEHTDLPLGIELHDAAVEIVSRKSVSVKKRFLAVLELLEPHDPDRRKQ